MYIYIYIYRTKICVNRMLLHTINDYELLTNIIFLYFYNFWIAHGDCCSYLPRVGWPLQDIDIANILLQ